MADNRQFVDEFAKSQIELCLANSSIDPDLFSTYGVKRGLRDKSGAGVLAGLSNISLIQSKKQVDGRLRALPVEPGMHP